MQEMKAPDVRAGECQALKLPNCGAAGPEVEVRQRSEIQGKLQEKLQ